jgi:DNA-binding transcriptional MerR regulator
MTTTKHLTSTAAARRAGCHPNTVKNLCRKGLVEPMVLSDGTRAFDDADVERSRALVDGSKRRPRKAP